MRSLILSVFVLAGTPALAQEIYCEGVVEGAAGEVIAGYNLTPDGTIKSSTLSWMPPRDKYQSFDAQFMTSPRLMLHYRMGEGGRLAGPSNANVVTTQFSIPRTGKASPLEQVQVEAELSPSGSKLSWKASEPGKGEPKLAELVKNEDPTRLVIKLREGKKVTANAEFDLKARSNIDQMAVKARAEADENVAKYRKLIADGKKPRECPY
ncbi:MAG TPA: hypothetical protein VIA80_00875 [Hyphomonadaceae bacterium]|jgi:hypothetical protein